MQVNFFINEIKVPPGMKLLRVQDNSVLYSISKCSVCNSNLLEVMKVSATNNTDVHFGRGYCLNCGYFGVTRTFSPEWIDDYYRKNWTNTKQVEEAEFSSDLINEWTRKFILKYVSDKEAYILDAGAGYGSSIKGLVESGYKNVQALELSERRVRILRKKYDIIVDSIPIQNIQESKTLAKKFDAIYLWHVLEHLSKLEDYLDSLHKSLKIGGYLFIAVPNFCDEHFANLLNLQVHMHSFQPHTLNYLMSKYGFEHVESHINNDGSGIRAMYKKVSDTVGNPDPQWLSSRSKLRDIYHEKIFKDFQLMYLVHQPKWTHRNILLSFHYNSSFAGSCLHRHPLSKKEAKLYEYWVKINNERLEKDNFFIKVKNRLISKFASKLAIPEGSMLFDKIDGIPHDPYPYRLIYNTDDLMMLNFYHKDKEIKLWQE